MLAEANQQLGELAQQGGDRERILAEGIAGEAVIVGMGTPARGAPGFAPAPAPSGGGGSPTTSASSSGSPSCATPAR
jgi:hypothetical protein